MSNIDFVLKLFNMYCIQTALLHCKLRDGVVKLVMLAMKRLVNSLGGHMQPINLGSDSPVHILLGRAHGETRKSRK